MNNECIELHCSAAHTTHTYGSPSCDWLLTPDGEVVGKSEAQPAEREPRSHK